MFYLLSFNGGLVVGLPQKELLHLPLHQRHHGGPQQQGRGGGHHQARGGGDHRGGDEGRGQDDGDGSLHFEESSAATSTLSSHFSLFTDHETNILSEIVRDQIFGGQMSQIQM